ncbi:MAG: phospholipid carrier-dependent glycosyltransferase [Novosphingobium sp.]|nr:phospholipid carrier-dependent glycosyltransferase [Novosphingobium sp.]
MRISGEGGSDPRAWCAAITLAFLALILFRIGTPASIYFDELHYTKAARKLLTLNLANREHPLFAKEVIAASIALFGDNSTVWRVPSALFGTLGFYAFGRLMWLVSQRRAATIFAMLLVACNFSWFVQSRIAMLDIYAASLALVGLWQFAAALESGRPRLRLALSGIAIGLAMASKWSVVPLALLPGLTFFALKLRRNDFPAIKRIGLAEAFAWLGLLPLAVYWLTFTPAFFYHDDPHRVGPLGFWAQHARMIAMQDSVIKPHAYQSVWWQWMLNLRPIWYLYENVDGAQRGVLMLGNPLTMLAGLPALVWCLWAALARKRRDALVMAVGYAAALGLWLVSGKPVQFYYHYLLPGVFLSGALGLTLDQAWRKGGPWRGASLVMAAGSLAMFAWFWPILSAAPLAGGKGAFVEWMWLKSWR